MKRTYICLFFTLISVHICHSCPNISNYNVTFNATNFEYMLHWSKPDLAPDVSFNVQYTRYGGKKWLLLHNCQNITRVYCNLTNAIVDDVEDFMKNQYFGRVKILSTNCTYDWVISKRLNPRDDTYLVLPKLNYIQHVNSITILVPTLSTPIRGKDKQPVTVEDLYKDDDFEYHLKFYNPKQEIWQKTQTGRIFEVSGLSPDTEYRGSIYISIGKERKSAIQFFVIRTLPDYSLITLIASLTAVFIITLVAGLLFLSCKYIKQQEKTPNSLVFKKSPTLPLMTLPKDQLISSCTAECYPATSMQNYDQNHQKTSRKTWQGITRNSQLYASQSNDGITWSQDSAVDTKGSCYPQNISSSLYSVHYGKLFVRANHNMTYFKNTIPNPSSKDVYASEGDFQIKTNQPFVDWVGDVSTAFIDIPFKFSLFSSSLGPESNTVFNSIPSMGLISSVTVKYDSDFTTPMKQTETHASDSHIDGFTSNQMEEHNLQCSLLEHGDSSYILQRPEENVTKDTLDSIVQYKSQCIL
ncbi:hypothetical protein GDO78_014743 [Eleutherodactylus coqui]|uniref:Fibronectin type-III domain-containing protein n=1 Tax=Eleutherodactylus coqui TaxID=57060 RepID=A0A8J6JKJ1_ELECQ|nr:hypothetical protein GDO78_014743 [Eleutherodactylus coqui]